MCLVCLQSSWRILTWISYHLKVVRSLLAMHLWVETCPRELCPWEGEIQRSFHHLLSHMLWSLPSINLWTVGQALTCTWPQMNSATDRVDERNCCMIAGNKALVSVELGTFCLPPLKANPNSECFLRSSGHAQCSLQFQGRSLVWKWKGLGWTLRISKMPSCTGAGTWHAKWIQELSLLWRFHLPQLHVYTCMQLLCLLIVMAFLLSMQSRYWLPSWPV